MGLKNWVGEVLKLKPLLGHFDLVRKINMLSQLPIGQTDKNYAANVRQTVWKQPKGRGLNERRDPDFVWTMNVIQIGLII